MLRFLCFCLLGSLLVSCSKEIKTKQINDFLLGKKIDTTQYKSLDNLVAERKISKMHIVDFPLHNPMIDDQQKLVYIQVASNNEDEYKFLKLDFAGNIKDSLSIVKNNDLTNYYIIGDEFYNTWFWDGDKTNKKIEVLSIAKNDVSSFQKLAEQLNSEKLFYTIDTKFGNEVSEKAKSDTIDSSGPPTTAGYTETQNRLIYVKDNKIYAVDLLGIDDKIEDIFRKGDNFGNTKSPLREMEGKSADNYITLDDFYAKTLTTYPGGGFSISVSGNSAHSDYYKGSAFLSLKNYNLKIKQNGDRDKVYAKSVSQMYDFITDQKLSFILVTSFDIGKKDCYLIKK
ncbi:hypothetical protein [Soonwooa sp.]|uniref:hypothetical protein n=1 Tax=Soonwooa sp. TaxID=1938592 RepID=UPI002606C183|nr:hypothetical protein [Soonwooa sp.]